MLLSGNIWAFMLLLVTSSSLILDGFAAPVLQRRLVLNHYIPPTGVVPPRPLPLENYLDDRCNYHQSLEYTDEGREMPRPIECQLVLPKDEEPLTLWTNDGSIATSYGKLGSRIGSGTYGTTFDVPDGWSTEPGKRAVAKWLGYKDVGVEELLNTIAVGDALAYGIHVDRSLAHYYPGLWVIIPWKEGEVIHDLQSFRKDVLNRESRDDCTKYMSRVRSAVIYESMRYAKLSGAPIHNDLHIGNVLLREDPDTKRFHANLIDWGDVYWYYPNGQIPTGEWQINDMANVVKQRVKSGYDWKGKGGAGEKPEYFDFSDENNCFEPPNLKQVVAHKQLKS